MSVENVSTFSGLVENSPSGDDSIKEGDNHLTLIKRVLKRQFTGGKPAGPAQGLDAPVTVSAAEFNFLLRARANIQDQIDYIATLLSAHNLLAPSGTKMIFCQAVPPAGWTKDTSLDGHMLVTTTGTSGGTNGGTADPKSFNWTHSHTVTVDGTTLSWNQMPRHSHHMFSNTTAGDSTPGADADDFVAVRDSHDNYGDYYMKGMGASASLGIVEYSGADAPHGHSASSSSAGSTWTPKYLNVIRATKS